MPNQQKLRVKITALVLSGVLHNEEFDIEIDASADARPGGWKAQEGEIENQVVHALNNTLVALDRDRN